MPFSSYATGVFGEGLVPAHTINLSVGKDFVTHFINRQGNPEFKVDGYGETFHEGFSAINLNTFRNNDTTGGFIDHEGKFAIPPTFVQVKSFSEGLAAAKCKKSTAGPYEELWGYVDKTGAYRIEPQFHVADPFHGGVALVQIGGKLMEVTDARSYYAGGEWWLIDQNGKKLKRSWLPDGAR